MATVLGISSPSTIWNTVARAKAMAMDTPRTSRSPSNGSSRGSMSWARIGSARKPSTREVTVMPSCAPESWNDNLESSDRTSRARREPPSAKVAMRLRSAATSPNSAATNTPVTAMSTTMAASPSAVLMRTTPGHGPGSDPSRLHR